MMSSSKFSVVIPAYNQAQFLPDAINSVLNQTEQNFEVIIVNDFSPDNTSEIVNRFSDPRIKYIVHDSNKGLPATRNTGMRAASGDLIALLDADDLFHPEKLRFHNEFLASNPEINISYNPRFNLNHSTNSIRDIFRPPKKVGLIDFVHGFPFTPSDMVIRKVAAEAVDFFDERYICGGEDLEFPCRLALSGYQFASVDKALNYRRYHSRKHRKNLPCRRKDVERAIQSVFDDPRCPIEVKKIGDLVYTHHFLVLIYEAFIQELTELGQEYFSDLIKINPNVISGEPSIFTEFMLNQSTLDHNLDHTIILNLIFSQLPQNAYKQVQQLDWAVPHGYLLKSIRNIIWGDENVAVDQLSQARKLEARFRKQDLQHLSQHIVNYEVEFGFEATQQLLIRLLPSIVQFISSDDKHKFLSYLEINRGFEHYSHKNFNLVPRFVLSSIIHNPVNLFNRGNIAILLKSLVYRHGRIDSNN